MNKIQPAITLSFTPKNLKQLLLQVCDRQNTFSHKELAYWCDKYTLHYYEYDVDENKWMTDIEGSGEKRELAQAYAVAKDIGWKWYLYMIKGTTYTEVTNYEMNQFELPGHLFVKWLNELYSY